MIIIYQTTLHGSTTQVVPGFPSQKRAAHRDRCHQQQLALQSSNSEGYKSDIVMDSFKQVKVKGALASATLFAMEECTCRGRNWNRLSGISYIFLGLCPSLTRLKSSLVHVLRIFAIMTQTMNRGPSLKTESNNMFWSWLTKSISFSRVWSFYNVIWSEMLLGTGTTKNFNGYHWNYIWVCHKCFRWLRNLQDFDCFNSAMPKHLCSWVLKTRNSSKEWYMYRYWL